MNHYSCSSFLPLPEATLSDSHAYRSIVFQTSTGNILQGPCSKARFWSSPLNHSPTLQIYNSPKEGTKLRLVPKKRRIFCLKTPLPLFSSKSGWVDVWPLEFTHFRSWNTSGFDLLRIPNQIRKVSIFLSSSIFRSRIIHQESHLFCFLPHISKAFL